MKMSCAAQYLLAAYASVPNISRHFNYITWAHEYLSSGFFFIISNFRRRRRRIPSYCFFSRAIIIFCVSHGCSFMCGLCVVLLLALRTKLKLVDVSLPLCFSFYFICLVFFCSFSHFDAENVEKNMFVIFN